MIRAFKILLPSASGHCLSVPTTTSLHLSLQGARGRSRELETVDIEPAGTDQNVEIVSTTGLAGYAHSFFRTIARRKH